MSFSLMLSLLVVSKEGFFEIGLNSHWRWIGITETRLGNGRHLNEKRLLFLLSAHPRRSMIFPTPLN